MTIHVHYSVCRKRIEWLWQTRTIPNIIFSHDVQHQNLQSQLLNSGAPIILGANFTSVFVAEDTNHPGLTWLRFGNLDPPNKMPRNHENLRRYDWMSSRSSSSWVFCILLTDWTHGCWCFLFTLFYPTCHPAPQKNKALQRLITDQQKLSNKSPSKEILKTALGCCFQETAPWFFHPSIFEPP